MKITIFLQLKNLKSVDNRQAAHHSKTPLGMWADHLSVYLKYGPKKSIKQGEA